MPPPQKASSPAPPQRRCGLNLTRRQYGEIQCQLSFRFLDHMNNYHGSQGRRRKTPLLGGTRLVPQRTAKESSGRPVSPVSPGGGSASGQTGTARVKRGMAEMLKGGVIMDVVTPEQARIAEGAGAVAVMALERVPADIRAQGGVSRMSDPDMIEGIISAVTIPVMAKARIGHFVEAQILQSLGWTTSTNPRSSLPPTTHTTSTSGSSPCPSCAGPPTSVRHCGASARARR